MNPGESARLIGRLAIHYKVLSKDRVTEALRLWQEAGAGEDFTSFLAARGFIAPAVGPKLLKARDQYLAKEAQKAQAPAVRPPTAASAPDPPAPPAAAEPPPKETPLTPEVEAPLVPSDPGATAQAPPVEPAPAVAPPAGAAPIEAPPAEAATSSAPAAPPPVAEPPASPAAELPSRPPPSPAATAPMPVIPAIESVPRDPSWPLRFESGVTLEDLLRQTRDLEASDLHVHSGSSLRVRLNGELQESSQAIDRSIAEPLILGMLTAEQRELLEAHKQLDFAHEIDGVGRFRANVYYQQRGLDGVFRAIPPTPPSLQDLGLPETLTKLSSYHQGMVLFTGPAGCGKSSTMAAMVRKINESRPDHIITVEDPIEYVHASDRCIVNQRQVGPHTESFARALRGALREDPDIIVIGEMRDLETISLALTAAETGHLVLGTLHTSSAIRTINRLLGVFPPDQQAQIRTMVSESLRAVVSQRLLPRADGQGRVPALEILVNNKAVGNLIRENKTFQIFSVMQTGSTHGMCLLDSSLSSLVKTGAITKQAAREQAEKPETFR